MERKLLSKVWGGRALEDTLGLELPEDGAPIGESWEVYDRPEGSSPIRGSDETLGQLVRRCPEELVGRDVRLGHKGAFPLTLKFLDAREACSLQVHPSDEQAHDDIGKDECCLILHTDERASFVHGVREGVEEVRVVPRVHEGLAGLAVARVDARIVPTMALTRFIFSFLDVFGPNVGHLFFLFFGASA